MYLEYFGLSEAPFAITPDPTFIYLSGRHRDALAHLLYGVGQGGSGGFVQLTGEVGTGKTTLCRCLLEQVPEGTRIALVLNPLMGPLELLAAICEELGIDTYGIEHSGKALVDRLNQFLLHVHREGERVVVVVDEAQNLSPEALEQIRLLTNLETHKQKLLQVILLGQPELRELLRRRNLRQLAQRITARFHLTPLSPEDTARYVRHRMQVAGASRNPFRRSALKALYQRSRGVPRLINIIADRALAGAYAREARDIDARLVHAAANEVQLGEPGVGERRWHRPLAWAAGGALVAAVGWFLLAPHWPLPDPGAQAKPEALAAATTPALPAGEDLPDSGEQAARPAPAEPTDAAPPREPGMAVRTADTAGAAPPEPIPERTLQVIDAAWLTEQDLLAWRGLARAWGRPQDAGLVEAACRGSAGLGYACLRETGNWARLRRLDLPVVLYLQDAEGRHLLLRGIDEGVVLAGAGDHARTVTREAVEELWLGAYFVAWPQAPGWPREVSRGDAGPAVDTILAMAAETDTPYRGEAGFDLEFERWLMEFQRRNGLEADGIVGPRTLLYLVSASLQQPRLVSAWTPEA